MRTPEARPKAVRRPPAGPPEGRVAGPRGPADAGPPDDAGPPEGRVTTPRPKVSGPARRSCRVVDRGPARRSCRDAPPEGCRGPPEGCRGPPEGCRGPPEGCRG